MEAEPAVYLISGPMGAGKSTAARLLAGRFARGVHLEGDVFRRNIVAGREEMTPAAGDEALAQLRLRYRLAAAAAETYADAGFTVAFEDVVAGPLLTEVSALVRTRPCHVVVLLPSAAALAARAGERYTSWSVEQLHGAFARDTPRLGVWLDTSELTPEAIVDEILARSRP
ncbi:MAG TPA: AAA family ATPase [Gaiellaceae bacterium]|nr:AAA family ATPase [Gaiellaceae bacterium]